MEFHAKIPIAPIRGLGQFYLSAGGHYSDFSSGYPVSTDLCDNNTSLHLLSNFYPTSLLMLIYFHSRHKPHSSYRFLNHQKKQTYNLRCAIINIFT